MRFCIDGWVTALIDQHISPQQADRDILMIENREFFRVEWLTDWENPDGWFVKHGQVDRGNPMGGLVHQHRIHSTSRSRT